MKPLGLELRGQTEQEQADEQQRADGVTDVQCLGEEVTAGFAQGGRGDLRDPEERSDLRELLHGSLSFLRTRRPSCFSLRREA